MTTVCYVRLSPSGCRNKPAELLYSGNIRVPLSSDVDRVKGRRPLAGNVVLKVQQSYGPTPPFAQHFAVFTGVCRVNVDS